MVRQWIVEGQPLIDMLVGSSKGPQAVQDPSQPKVGMHAEGRVMDALCQREEPLHQRTRRLPLRAHRMPRTPSIQHPAVLRHLAHLLP